MSNIISGSVPYFPIFGQNAQSGAPGRSLEGNGYEGMTVTEAAKELQVSRITLSKVLNGGNNFNNWSQSKLQLF
jgi:hypothetical protein